MKRLKKCLAILLTSILLLLMFSVASFANQSRYYKFRSNYTLTGDPVSDIVAVASAQIGARQTELGYTEDWCDNFISDCAIIINQEEAIPQGGNVTDFVNNLLKAGAKYVSSPQKGDIVIFHNKRLNAHAGLMVDSTYCINGNFSTKGYSQVEKYAYSSIKAYNGWTCSFIRPNYSKTFSLNVNITVDGETYDSDIDDITFDLHINSNKIADDVSEYSYKHISDSSYTIDDIKIGGCRALSGNKTYSGTLSEATAITIPVVSTHDWNSGVIAEETSYYKSGQIIYTCAVCGEAIIEVIPRLTLETAPVEEKESTVYVYPGLTAEYVTKTIGTGTVILGLDGSVLDNEKIVGSGMTLVKADKTRKVIIVKGDIDSDGAITASDSRFALRSAVLLEEANDWQKNAGNVDGDVTVTPSDARLILRAAVDLETLISIDI